MKPHTLAGGLLGKEMHEDNRTSLLPMSYAMKLEEKHLAP